MNQEQSNQSAENSLLSDQELDHLFKSELEHHQVPPRASVSSKIRNAVFLNPLFYFNKRVFVPLAASVLFVLTATSIYLWYPQSEQTQKHFPVAQEQIVTVPADAATSPAPLHRTGDFVLDIQSENGLEDAAVRAEIIEQELDDYLAFLLADEEEFANAIDSTTISKSLESAEVLDLDDLFATIPRLPRKEVITILAPEATEITLPHRFIENEKEIETYLLIYEDNLKGE